MHGCSLKTGKSVQGERGGGVGHFQGQRGPPSEVGYRVSGTCAAFSLRTGETGGQRWTEAGDGTSRGHLIRHSASCSPDNGRKGAVRASAHTFVDAIYLLPGSYLREPVELYTWQLENKGKQRADRA